MIARSVVVLPTPLRPSSATDSPLPTSSDTPCRMCSLPRCTCTPESLSMRFLVLEDVVLRAAEVGLAHALVGADRLRRAARQHRALRHHRDVVGKAEDHFHVVLD